MIVRISGSWNKEAALEFDRDFRQFVGKISIKPWGSIVDANEWELATPDVWDTVYETALWASRHNHRFEAVICRQELAKHLMEQRFDVTPSLKKSYWENKEAALAWCQEQYRLLASERN
ncbi:hypothetical protein [Vibrio marisflavi]|uniref:hypothetical protein n=1 Tax=Vibrio marisflavi TaxID=1216040 RepID=UPI001F3F8FC8|nr:hypothetical protein [Vibrio marisflavi]